MLLAGAATFAATITYGFWIVQHGGDRRGPARGQCSVRSTHAISVDPGALGLRVVARGDDAWVLLAQGPSAGSGPTGEARVQVVYMPARGASTRTEPVTVAADPRSTPQGDVAADLVLSSDGPTLLYADARRIQRLGPLVPRQPPPAATEVPYPGSEALAAERLSAALAPNNGPVALVVRGGSSGSGRGSVVQVDARGARRREGLTPRRRDRWATPHLAIVGDRVWVAQERRLGHWDAPAPRIPGGAVEVAIAPLAGSASTAPTVVTVSRDSTDGRIPRLAPADLADPTRGAVVTWRDGLGVVAARVSDEGPGRTWAVREFVRVATAPDPVPTASTGLDLAPLSAACGHLVAWRTATGIDLRAIDLPHGTVHAVRSVTLGEGGVHDDARVRLVAAGSRNVLALDGPEGVMLYGIATDAACALQVTPLALSPRPLPGAPSRLVGLGIANGRVVLGTTTAPPLVHAGTLDLWALDATATLVQRTHSLALPLSPAELTVEPDGAVTVLGRTAEGWQWRRMEGNQPGPAVALPLRELDEVSLSTAAGRPWVVGITGLVATAQAPAQGAVVLGLARPGSADGAPTWSTSLPVEAAFARHTLDALSTAPDGGHGPAWGTTFSESAPDAPDCLAGAFAALYDASLGPFTPPGSAALLGPARPLLDPAMARCGDRVMSASWRGASVVATMRRADGATLAVQRDLLGDATRALALDPQPAVAVAHPAVSTSAEATLALWIDPVAEAPRIRSRMFGLDGAPLGPAETLGEMMASGPPMAPGRALPLAHAGGGQWVAVLPSAHGPRLARLHCGL